MPYLVKAPAGAWTPGAVVEDAEFTAHPFHQKFLTTGSVVTVSPADAAAAQKAGPQAAAQVADLDSQIAVLHTSRAALLQAPALDATAPAQVAYDLDRLNPPTATEAAATRAAGQEVIQPGPGAPVTGALVPGEAAPTAPAPKPSAKKRVRSKPKPKPAPPKPAGPNTGDVLIPNWSVPSEQS